jgi:hypothetical protein
MRLSDRLVFSVTNFWFYLTRPLFVVRCRRHLGYWPSFATPHRFAELMQWRKLFDKNPQFVTFSDKLATRKWVAARLPALPDAEILWVGERPEDIPDALLTPGHVVKTSNGSGQNYFPHRKALPREEVNRLFRRWLHATAMRRALGWLDSAQEWAYHHVPPRVFVERQLGISAPVVDITVRVMGGVPLLASCALEFKTEAGTLGYFWPDGTPLEGPNVSTLPAGFAAPPRFAEAMQLAVQLGQGADYLRIDFLAVGDKLHAGEITVYPASGFGPDEWYMQLMYRRWIETLPLSWALSTPQPWPKRLYLGAFRRWLERRQREVADLPLPKG